jgi:P-type E1-E2 ATPase
VDTLAFDKTGTLTEGRPEVARVWAARDVAEEEVLCAAAGAEAGSEHPLAAAVVEAARARGVSFEARVRDLVSTPGLGVRSGDVLVGNLRWLAQQGVEAPAEARAFAGEGLAQGQTVLLVARGGSVLGGLALRDRVREEAGAVAGWARGAGIRTLLLTGDQEAPARAVASAVGVGETRAALLPADKLTAIRGLQEEGRTVAYIGDGTNDGPALAQAQLGVSLSSRCNTVALETAHAVLMEGGLSRLPFLIELGRRTVRTIYQNILVFGLALNAVMLTLSTLGYLTPVLAALAHNAGSVAVVLNSARLLGRRRAGGNTREAAAGRRAETSLCPKGGEGEVAKG